MPKALVAYVPVLHRGYYELFQKNRQVDTIWVWDSELIGQFDELRKDIRALEPRLIVAGIHSWALGPHIQLLNLVNLKRLATEKTKIIMPDDQISRELTAKFLPSTKVKFEPVFLRWDRRNSLTPDPLDPNRTISAEQFDQDMMKTAHYEGLKSSNIWRRVGGLIVKNGKIILQTSNRHQPTDYTPWIDGDPRTSLNRGVGIEISTDSHAEALLVAEAAKQGVSLKGTDLYITTFPCPPCAKMVAHSGIKRCYYGSGYAVVDGQSVLKEQGVELIHVEGVEGPNDPAFVPYPKKNTLKK